MRTAGRQQAGSLVSAGRLPIQGGHRPALLAQHTGLPAPEICVFTLGIKLHVIRAVASEFGPCLAAGFAALGQRMWHEQETAC